MVPVAYKERVYQSYLLRMWVEVIDGEQTWRLSVEDPFTSERRGFTTLDELCAYLAQRMKDQVVEARSDQQK
jgi:hypothetical protein